MGTAGTPRPVARSDLCHPADRQRRAAFAAWPRLRRQRSGCAIRLSHAPAPRSRHGPQDKADDLVDRNKPPTIPVTLRCSRSDRMTVRDLALGLVGGGRGVAVWL